MNHQKVSIKKETVFRLIAGREQRYSSREVTLEVKMRRLCLDGAEGYFLKNAS